MEVFLSDTIRKIIDKTEGIKTGTIVRVLLSIDDILEKRVYKYLQEGQDIYKGYKNLQKIKYVHQFIQELISLNNTGILAAEDIINKRFEQNRSRIISPEQQNRQKLLRAYISSEKRHI